MEISNRFRNLLTDRFLQLCTRSDREFAMTPRDSDSDARDTQGAQSDITQLKKSSGSMQWIVLALACFLLFGNYYCYDIPGALNVQLRQWMGHAYDEWQYELNGLYTAYSFPNLVMPILGGVLVDTMGPTRMLIFFSAVVVTGQALFTVGVTFRTYWLMIVGRVLFGMGGESLEVAQAHITTAWFRNRSLGLALGLNLTCARLATALNDWVSPAIERQNSPIAASWFGTATCVASLFCAVFLAFLNRSGKLHQSGIDEEQQSLLGPSGEASTADQASTSDDTDASTAQDIDNDEEHETMRWSNAKKLPLSFWVLCLVIMLLYGAVNPFIHILSDFLQTKWYPGDAQRASAIMSIPDILSAAFSPVCGYLIDRLDASRKGNWRAYLLPSAGLILAVVHAMLGFTSITPILSLTLLGLSYSLFGAILWPMVPALVEDSNLLGTAYGISTVALNIALTFVPLVVAKIVAESSYRWATVFFIGLSLLGLLLSVVIAFIERRQVLAAEARDSRLPNQQCKDDGMRGSNVDRHGVLQPQSLKKRSRSAPASRQPRKRYHVELTGDHHLVLIPNHHLPPQMQRRRNSLDFNALYGTERMQ